MIITKLSINNNVFLYVEYEYKNKINPKLICSNYLHTSSDGIFFSKKEAQKSARELNKKWRKEHSHENT